MAIWKPGSSTEISMLLGFGFLQSAPTMRLNFSLRQRESRLTQPYAPQKPIISDMSHRVFLPLRDFLSAEFQAQPTVGCQCRGKRLDPKCHDITTVTIVCPSVPLLMSKSPFSVHCSSVNILRQYFNNSDCFIIRNSLIPLSMSI